MRFVLAPLAALMLATSASAQVAPLTPTELGTLFCAATQSGDMSAIQPYIGDELDLAIARAEADSAVRQLEKPDEKPPLGDGVPWASYPDAADDCTVIYVNDNATPTEVAIARKYAGGADADHQDVLLVTGTGPDIEIVDLRYADGTTLSQFLADAVAQPN